MRIGIEGKVALITGASSGLGAHFAHVLAGAGARLAIAARRRDRLEALCHDLRGQGHDAVAIGMDVGQRDTIDGALSEIVDRFGRIDILVNNAGVTRTKPVLDYDDADFDEIVDVNLRGAFAVAQRTARLMRQSGSGSIINIASILGVRQAGQVASYAISKAGVIQMTKVLALECARYGIRVNAIAPGYVETELNAEFWQSDAGKALVKRIPQRRLGRLAELDGPLLLLASDLSTYMTGSVVTVDGGHLVSTL